MASTKDIVLFESGTFLFKGENGTGKTAAAGSFKKHKDGKIKFFDFDGKMDTIKLMYPTWDIEYEFFGLHNFASFLSQWERLQDNCPYDVIVLDSFTSLSMTVVNYQLKQKGGGKGDKTVAGGLQVTTWDEINGETVFIGKMLDISKILREHKKKIVIWTAHPISKTEIVGDERKVTRPITCYGPKIGSIAPAYFSEIYHFATEKTSIAPGADLKRKIYTQNSGEDYAKSSLGLPGVLDWTAPKLLYDVIQENVKKV